MTFQEIISSIALLAPSVIKGLFTKDQNDLFELIRTRRRAEILANSQELMQDFQNGTAKRGSVNDLIEDLLGDDDENCLE